ncbi:Acyl-CoA N-acyltransferases (Nat) [Daldinia childiae]|uniref:Acyl-CoA N-acyltransferases (Nat) n=1 Tax=Daldinia childiae TaxID=326645 RepID=UPI0014462A10|nr:Acyl-CoA N-acyltransferases (Nat) [Daldinia childiae]KAF3057435.1 Acyl-CoA N-acyltransferases (Nat) [Daldinia childiae]
MSLKLHELTNDEDFKAINAAEHEAYSNPFNGVFELTKGTSPEEACARQLVWHKIQPGSHWVYVTDESTGEVIGGTRYIIYETNPYAVEQPARKASWLPEGPLRQVGDHLLACLGKHRPVLMNKPHILISLCFVHSAHRKRGAASLMLEWGTQKADELGLESFVESTEMARRTYEKQGFYVIGDFYLDAQEENPSKEFIAERKRLECPIHGFIMKRDARDARDGKSTQ